MSVKVPVPKIQQRPIDHKRQDEALAAGMDPILARILAARPFLMADDPMESLTPKLKWLDNPFLLADMDVAVQRLLRALDQGEIIGIETDHDCDGQTSHAVLYTALTQFFGHPVEKIRSYIGHRLNEGYGLSAGLMTRILADSPQVSLIITADNGSSDEAQIAQLKAAGIDVIVTDHHEIPKEGIPQSAYAVVSPLRADSAYPDRGIAGCMVAWLVMAGLRQKRMESTQQGIPSLAEILDFVAVGTVADCVSMAQSRNNRAVVTYGIKLIQQGIRPCWRALMATVNPPLTSEDLGFKIGPLLNSDGRLACAFGSVSFLLAPTDEEAKRWIAHLQEQNIERKAIQDSITQQALVQADLQTKAGKKSLCIYLEAGHSGVHGISASRIKDWYGRPVIILCPKKEDPTVLTGSARSITGIHLRELLQAIHDIDSTLLVRFGGHQGAAGLTLHRDKLEIFAQHFEQQVAQQVSEPMIGPVLWTDGELPLENIELGFVEKLVGKLEPFGREFEPPLFDTQAKVVSLQAMGKTATHARLGLSIEDLWVEAVWFNAKDVGEDWPIATGDNVRVVFSPKVNAFRGNRRLSCQVVYLERL